MRVILGFSTPYFLAVFATGFVLGTLRVLVLVDILGERGAELAELPVMALVCALVARYLVDRYRARLTTGRAFFAGGVALLMLLAVEFTVVLTLQGLSVSEYFASRDPVAGAAYAVALFWFALAPLVFYRLGSSDNS